MSSRSMALFTNSGSSSASAVDTMYTCRRMGEHARSDPAYAHTFMR